MSDLKTVQNIPCRCPECDEVIERCAPCLVKKKTSDILKDYGAVVGHMALAALQKYLTPPKDKDK